MRPTPHNAPPGFDWIETISAVNPAQSVLDLALRTAQNREAHLHVAQITPEIWRMTFIPPGASAPQPTPMLIDSFRERMPNAVMINDDGEVIAAQGSAFTTQIERNSFSLRFLDQDGRERLRDNPGDIDGLGRPFVLPLGFITDAAGAVTAVTQSFHLRQDEHFFGFGEKFTPLDKRGQRIVTWTQDAFGSTSERSHKNIPLLLSTRGYGLFLDTGARVTWDLGVTSCQSYTITAECESLTVYYIFGDTLSDLLYTYTEITGRAPLPPRWSFGLWLSGAGTYRDQASHEALIDGLEQHDIPADVLHVDTWWLRWRLYCDFQWDRAAFPDVEGFIAKLKARGLRLTLWEHPYMSIESDLFNFGSERGYFLTRPDTGQPYIIDYGLSLAPRPDGVIRTATPETSWNARVAIIDLTNEDAVRWFQELHRPILRMGADAFKTDFGEDIPRDAIFANGQTGATMHNLYPLLYNKAVYEVTEQEKGYGLVWSRSGTAGSQRYPVCWSGDPAADFDSLACTIRGGLSIGMSGVPFWSSDIGGYRGKPSPRLYVRWAQFGLFSSHSRMHGDSPREPWHYGTEALDIVRKYVKLRYTLLPYIYSAAVEATRTGVPVIRAMPLAFPDDPNCYDKDLQYMFGPSLLVAPIYDEGDERNVYLPAGEWINYWTGERYTGPLNLHVKAPLDTLPLFVRAGAAIPTAPNLKRVPEGDFEEIVWQVYSGGTAGDVLNE